MAYYPRTKSASRGSLYPVSKCTHFTPEICNIVRYATLNVKPPNHQFQEAGKGGQLVATRDLTVDQYKSTNPRPLLETQSENRDRMLLVDVAVLRHCCGLRVRMHVTNPLDPVDTEATNWGAVALQALADYRPHPSAITGGRCWGCNAIADIRSHLTRVVLTAQVHLKPETPDDNIWKVALEVPKNGLSWMTRTPLDLIAYVLRRCPEWLVGGWSPELAQKLATEADWVRSDWGEWEPKVSLLSKATDAGTTTQWLTTLRDRYLRCYCVDSSTSQGLYPTLHAAYGPCEVPLTPLAVVSSLPVHSNWVAPPHPVTHAKPSEGEILVDDTTQPADVVDQDNTPSIPLDESTPPTKRAKTND